MMHIYSIHAGDAYGPHNWWTLTNKKKYDIEILHEFFLKTDPDISIFEDFGQTKEFVQWLCKNHGFTLPDVIELFTES